VERRSRKQTGTIVQISGRWFVRYYERRTVNGVIERRRVTHVLGPITTRGTTPPDGILKEAERHMLTVNNCEIPLSQVVKLSEFVETVFLPTAEKRLKKSTYRNYKGDWERRIKPLVARDRKNLKDYRTFDIQGWLNHVSRDASLSRNSLKGIKSFVSGLFKEARRLGYLDGPNPAQDTRVSPDAAEPSTTHAYTLEEISSILAVLPEPASTAFAVAAYSGLRRGEIEGLEWTDYHDSELHVQRSIWHGEAVTPKTAKSAAAVPVIRPLAERLEMHRLRSGSPDSGPIFRTSNVTEKTPNGTPLSLHNTVNRQILPALNRCVHCGLSEGLPHLKTKNCPGYERDSRIPEWQGFHAARRGLGSNLYRLGIHELVIQRILRHSNVSTTTTYYIKSTQTDVTDAMSRFEKNLPKSEGQNSRDTYGTLKPNSDATSEFVN
jgi:integrase